MPDDFTRLRNISRADSNFTREDRFILREKTSYKGLPESALMVYAVFGGYIGTLDSVVD
jgi:hypothetical protein